MPNLQTIVVYAFVLAAPWCVVWLWRRDVVRPGALSRLADRGGLRNPAAVPAAAWLGAAFATFAATVVGAGAAAALMGVPSGPASSAEPGSRAIIELAAYFAAAGVGFLCAGLIARVARDGGAGARTLGLECRPGDAWKGIGGLVVTLPLCVAAGATAAWVAKLLQAEPEQVAHSTLREIVADRHAWHAWMRSAMAVVGAPVMEELVYRVFLQSAVIAALARLRAVREGGPIAASATDTFWGIVLSTAAFVLPHASAVGGPAGWNALPSLTILGIGLGVVYERTRSPLAPIVMHAGFNALNIAAAVLSSNSAAAGPA